MSTEFGCPSDALRRCAARTVNATCAAVGGGRRRAGALTSRLLCGLSTMQLGVMATAIRAVGTASGLLLVWGAGALRPTNS